MMAIYRLLFRHLYPVVEMCRRHAPQHIQIQPHTFVRQTGSFPQNARMVVEADFPCVECHIKHIWSDFNKHMCLFWLSMYGHCFFLFQFLIVMCLRVCRAEQQKKIGREKKCAHTKKNISCNNKRKEIYLRVENVLHARKEWRRRRCGCWPNHKSMHSSIRRIQFLRLLSHCWWETASLQSVSAVIHFFSFSFPHRAYEMDFFGDNSIIIWILPSKNFPFRIRNCKTMTGATTTKKTRTVLKSHWIMI